MHNIFLWLGLAAIGISMYTPYNMAGAAFYLVGFHLLIDLAS